MEKLVQNLLHKELSYAVHGAAIEVRKDFGPGHKEQLYQKAFEEELKRRKVDYEREKGIKIFSPKDGKFIGLYRPDFIIDNKVIVEIKAGKFVSRDEIKRIYDYLRNSEYELAYFLNFASPQLYVKRIIFTNDRKPFYKYNPPTDTNKKLNNTKSLLVSISLILVLISGVSFAEAKGLSIFVSPPIFELELEPGKIYRDEIDLLNKSDLAIPMETKVVNFRAVGETGSIDFETGEEDISINPRKWFKIETPYFILDPHQSKKIKFEINLPENAEPGGHYATILFEPKLPSFYYEEKASKAIPEVGVLFLISIKVEGLTRPEEPLTIVEFNIPENFHLKKLENFLASFAGIFTEVQAAKEEVFSIVEISHLPFTLRIKNNDIYHTKPEGKLTISRTPLINTNIKLINTKIVGETEIKETTILPGKIRSFPIEFKPDLPEKLEKYLPASISNFISQNWLFGKYRAHLSLTTELGTIKKDIEFWAFPWKVGLSTVLIFALLLFLLVKYRQRILKAISVLFKKSI